VAYLLRKPAKVQMKHETKQTRGGDRRIQAKAQKAMVLGSQQPRTSILMTTTLETKVPQLRMRVLSKKY
jgi:hypothetical protein